MKAGSHLTAMVLRKAGGPRPSKVPRRWVGGVLSGTELGEGHSMLLMEVPGQGTGGACFNSSSTELGPDI